MVFSERKIASGENLSIIVFVFLPANKCLFKFYLCFY